MGLLILPGEHLKDTFYATHLGWYQRWNGAARGHIDPIKIAAMCLAGAKAQGCVEITVECDGLRPQRFTIEQVETAIRRYPEQFRGWVLPPPTSKAEAMLRRYNEKTMTPTSG